MTASMRRNEEPPSEDFFKAPDDPDRLEEAFEEGETEDEEDKEDLVQKVSEEETSELDSEPEHMHTIEPEDLQEEIAREVEGLDTTMGHEDDPERELDIEDESL
jgi:hypothetical protein